MDKSLAIVGLKYIAKYVDETDETRLLAEIDAEKWSTNLKRRVQHYGYRYDYRARKIDQSMHLGPLPPWATQLAARLVVDGHMPLVPDQLIVNEYEPGQGISAHTDCVPCFGPLVCSLSLGSDCVMNLSTARGACPKSMLLARGSLLVLAEEARYKWRHAIPGRKFDEVEGRKLPRSRRVSLTFRTVLLEL